MIHNFETAVDAIKRCLPQYLMEHGIDPSKKFRCINPGHEDSAPSANLVGYKNGGTPRVWCHGCSWTGDIFDVARLLENKPAFGKEWIEDTLKYLGNKYNIQIDVAPLTEEEMFSLNCYRAYKIAADQLSININNQLLKQELTKRNWQTPVLAINHIGIIDSFENYKQSLLNCGFSELFLMDIDLLRRDIFNPDNLIFTWKDNKGRPIGFIARDMRYESKKIEVEERGEKYAGNKYINTRSTEKYPLFKKGDSLYGLDIALQSKTLPVYLFEGQADVITAQQAGLLNCVAISSCNLREEQIQLLKSNFINSVVLCLDGDKPGRTKTVEILETRLANQSDLSVKVVELPEGFDPDRFIRENGINEFKKLAHWTAFEWKLLQYEEDADPETIAQETIPLIANESSPIIRESLCKILSTRTGISIRSLLEELAILIDTKSFNKSKERALIIERMNTKIKRSPIEAELFIQGTLKELYEVNKKFDADILSVDDFMKSLDTQKSEEELANDDNFGFKLGEDLTELEEYLRGGWSKDVVFFFGGKANMGKSALMCKIAHAIATNNEDVCVIYHTIDDTTQQLLPRLVSISEGSRTLSINMIRQPNYWKTIMGEEFLERRNLGYEKVKDLAKEGKLIIKDIVHGGSLTFSKMVISYYQEKYPNRRIVYILDNFHKLKGYEYINDERVRFKTMSSDLKELATTHHICILSTVEYRKFPSGIKPTNELIGESGQLEYDANFIAHVHNELSDTPDHCKTFHKALDWKGQATTLPRVELIVAKNKITEHKGSLFFDFYPSVSDFRGVDRETVMKDIRAVEGKEEDPKQTYDKDVAFGGLD